MRLDVDLIFHMQIHLQRREEQNISCITPSHTRGFVADFLRPVVMAL